MSDLRFEWDEAKNFANTQKHGVSFRDAAEVFGDPLHLTKFDSIEAGEERWRTYGVVAGIAVIMVAHTYRDDEGGEVIRIISARRATRSERRFYEHGNG